MNDFPPLFYKHPYNIQKLVVSNKNEGICSERGVTRDLRGHKKTLCRPAQKLGRGPGSSLQDGLVTSLSSEDSPGAPGR